jgi:hypothetical protein
VPTDSASNTFKGILKTATSNPATFTTPCAPTSP